MQYSFEKLASKESKTPIRCFSWWGPYREHTTKWFCISDHSNVWPFFYIPNICNSLKLIIFREEQLSSKIYLKIIWAWPMKFFATGNFMQRHLDCKNTAMKPVCFRPRKHIFLEALFNFLFGFCIHALHWHMSSKFWILLWTGSMNHCLDLRENTAYQSRSYIQVRTQSCTMLPVL